MMAKITTADPPLARPNTPRVLRTLTSGLIALLAVSRRMPLAASIFLSDQPSPPSASTCCFFSSLKTLAMRATGRQAQKPGQSSMGVADMVRVPE